MKTLLSLLFIPFFALAQPSADERQLVALTINYPPDHIDSSDYYLVADRPSNVKIKSGQTFIVQSAWRKEGDSVVTIGAGTVREINDYLGLKFKLYSGKKIRQGDFALFLVPLEKPQTDTLFFKMARLGIGFKSINDSSFYERNQMLSAPASYSTGKLLEAMAADVRFTGEAMLTQNDSQDTEITIGMYKGQRLFMMMKKANATDLFQFIRYVYSRPDKYRANEWRVSETFATWVINGAPKIL